MLIVHHHQRNHAQERQQASRERVQEKRHGSAPALRAAPQADQEEKRNQRELEENVEKHDVEAGEQAQEARLEGQQKRVIKARRSRESTTTTPRST